MMITITIVKPTTESPVMRARFFCLFAEAYRSPPLRLDSGFGCVHRNNPPKPCWRGKIVQITVRKSAEASLAGKNVRHKRGRPTGHSDNHTLKTQSRGCPISRQPLKTLHIQRREPAETLLAEKKPCTAADSPLN